MKKSFLCLAAVAMLLCSCTKTIDAIVDKGTSSTSGTSSIYPGFNHYLIKKGQHSAINNSYKAIEAEEMNFVVRFDSTAIYQSASPENQYDINKLYGFSDNSGDHHQFSARFGWRWSDNSLRLFAYIYNQGKVIYKELTTVPINKEINCSIKISGDKYIFLVNDVSETLTRASTTPKAKGYQLYPYFGGDEVAPHDVNVWIKNL